jgi:outer membrane protein assembly factor BamB
MERWSLTTRRILGICVSVGALALVVACADGTADTESSGSSGQDGSVEAGATPTPAASGVGSNWLHYGHDATYSSHNASATAISTSNVAGLQQKWGIGCNDAWFSVVSRSPAVFDGVLYSSSAGDKLRAFDARTGQELWQFGNQETGWAPPPVVSQDGVVFYLQGSFPTQLFALQADDGQLLWKAGLGFQLGYSDTTLVTVDEARGVVYLVEGTPFGDGRLFALEKSSGEVLWYKSETLDGASFEGDYVLLKDGKIYVDANLKQAGQYWPEDRILRIDAASQAVEHIFEKPSSVDVGDISKVALCGDALVATYCDRDDVFEGAGTLVAYSLASGQVLWQKAFPTGVKGTMACNASRSTLYVPSDPYVVALNPNTGQEIWRFTGFGPIYNPSVANGIVYVISDTNMYALDEQSGVRLLSFDLGYEGYETTQVAIGAGMLFVSGNGGTCDLYALGL